MLDHGPFHPSWDDNHMRWLKAQYEEYRSRCNRTFQEFIDTPLGADTPVGKDRKEKYKAWRKFVESEMIYHDLLRLLGAIDSKVGES